MANTYPVQQSPDGREYDSSERVYVPFFVPTVPHSLWLEDGAGGSPGPAVAYAQMAVVAGNGRQVL